MHSVMDPVSSSLIMAKIPDRLSYSMGELILSRIADAIAEKYVAEHYGEIAAKLDQNAIANLAIAEASKKIAEEIRARPTVIRETKGPIFNIGI